MMIYEITYQIRVSDFERGVKWYRTLLGKEPDFTPHAGFAEWELLPGCWLQVAEGTSSEGSGPLRLGILSIEAERERMTNVLDVENFEIYSREEVPVKWATFSDPWGNRIGFFESIKEEDKFRLIKAIKAAE